MNKEHSDVGSRRWSLHIDDSGEETRWELQWESADEFARHIAKIDDFPDALFPYPVQSRDERSLIVSSTGAETLASVAYEELSNAALVGVFESLGKLLRRIHELPSPSGFGDHQFGGAYHTFNAFMASAFTALSEAILELENDEVRDTAVETMANLRHELSAFHPHGRSTWTVGRPTPTRFSVRDNPTEVEALLDFGSVALRPPEYDLAALRIYGLLSDHPVADRAFWKGYGAAVTCDLSRRITYFENLINLERLVSRPALLPASK